MKQDESGSAKFKSPADDLAQARIDTARAATCDQFFRYEPVCVVHINCMQLLERATAKFSDEIALKRGVSAVYGRAGDVRVHCGLDQSPRSSNEPADIAVLAAGFDNLSVGSSQNPIDRTEHFQKTIGDAPRSRAREGC